MHKVAQNDLPVLPLSAARPQSHPPPRQLQGASSVELADPKLSLPSRTVLVSASLVLVLSVGIVDFITGYELNFFAFYLIPIAFSVWFIGTAYGVFVSALCVTASLAGDVRAGARYSSPLVVVWNALLALILDGGVVWIFARLRALQRGLEERVRQRTAALTDEMKERERLEEEILRVSEREQRRIGHDLHDSLCQHLTGTAFAAQALGERLEESAPEEAEAAGRVASLIEESIELTRRLARGLHPVELRGDGFADALNELAANCRANLLKPCAFECPAPVAVADPGVAIHLFRIAQEAVNNACKHSRARNICIRLERAAGGVTLSVADDGVGFPAAAPRGRGMGLSIMAYRARLIEAEFRAEAREGGGARVVVWAPASILEAPPARAASDAAD